MDLGTLATDLLRQAGTAYIQRELGPQPVAYAPPAVTTGAGMLTNAVDIPFVDVIPQPPDHSCGGSPVYKKVCGQYKWVTPKRRRRKRLATQGDLKDLAALRGILGQGKAFETWIATRS